MPRNTNEVIADLKALIRVPGYIYSLCIILSEDFYHDLNKIHEIDYRTKLSVKECSLIIGFLVQNEIEFTLPASPTMVIELKERTYELMHELQSSFNAHLIPKFQNLIEQQTKGETLEETREDKLNFFVKDNGMVEPMFYSGDGVYDFQYLEYLDLKYKHDSNWLIKNRNFYIPTIKEIVSQIKQTLGAKAKDVRLADLKNTFPKTVKEARKKLKTKLSFVELESTEREMFISATLYQYVRLFPIPPRLDSDNNSEGWATFYKNLLDLFIVRPSDFANVDSDSLESFFANFSFTPNCNHSYNGPGYFNILNSRPLINLGDNRFFVPLNFLISEAVYESPFYWMWDDIQYRDTLAKNRGEVGEEITYRHLSKVFGEDNTYRSVKVEAKKGEDKTDIDVLCVLGNKALCVQVKSKKLTLNAKRGDFDQLSKDFNGAVQDAYDQGIVSRKAILNGTARFIDKKGKKIKLPDDLNEVYIMGVTTENYPSLVHQVELMLVKESQDPYPVVLSVFDLELLTHYLNDAYDFLYYVRQRIDVTGYFRADEEMVYLGYHLRNKLCRMEECDWAMLDNYFGGVINRNYYPYKIGVLHLLPECDDPIQNCWKDPQFDLFIKAIKKSGHPKATDIVFHLLDWSSESRRDMVEHMRKFKQNAQSERTIKSVAIPAAPNFGVSYVVDDTAPEKLAGISVRYAMLRKYLSKCDAWLGMGSLTYSPNLIDYIVFNDEPWHRNIQFEAEHSETIAKMKKTRFTPIRGKRKIGRNDPCPCRSGKKYKKCCGR